MERISQRESVLLGYNFQRPFTNHPSSSPESQHGNSDVDFTDVFGGPPRRSSLQEVRYSFSETADSFASTSGDVDTKLSRNSLSGLNDKPVFGDENVNRRRYRNDGFFDDIFRGGESLSSSPRKHDRDSLSSTPGSRALSPAELMPHRADPWSPSLPAQFRFWLLSEMLFAIFVYNLDLIIHVLFSLVNINHRLRILLYPHELMVCLF